MISGHQTIFAVSTFPHYWSQVNSISWGFFARKMSFIWLFFSLPSSKCTRLQRKKQGVDAWSRLRKACQSCLLVKCKCLDGDAWTPKSSQPFEGGWSLKFVASAKRVNPAYEYHSLPTELGGPKQTSADGFSGSIALRYWRTRTFKIGHFASLFGSSPFTVSNLKLGCCFEHPPVLCSLQNSNCLARKL